MVVVVVVMLVILAGAVYTYIVPTCIGKSCIG